MTSIDTADLNQPATVTDLKNRYVEARTQYELAKEQSHSDEQLKSLREEWKIAKRLYKRHKHQHADISSNGQLALVTKTKDNAASSKEGAASDHDPGKRKRKRKRKHSNKKEVSSDATSRVATRTSLEIEDKAATVFIGGISYDANEDDLEEFFQSCGRILSIRMPRYQDSGKPRGYAHIDFVSQEALQKALSLNNSNMMGRYLEVKPANRRRSGADYVPSAKPAGCRTVFVKNLPYDTNEREVHDAFQFCGKIAEVRLARWGHTQQLKGIGYVQFLKEESAVTAVKKRGTIFVGNRNVVVDYEDGNPKASFRTGDRQHWSKVSRIVTRARKKHAGPRL